ncbi:MAG: transglutaminase-like domain-containing protein [Myxococcota bacterium]|nr:transglutaminase-like domain-containing protein [Myxococcota bacterium]
MPLNPLSRARSLGLDLSTARDDRERAVRIHDFVRDRVRFGLTPWFDVASPRKTLELGVGHCNPQGVLFASLLGAVGIDARLHFVTLTNDVLFGLWPDGGGPPRELSHAFSEVRLDGRWQRVDSYIVDPELRAGARLRLAEEGLALGFGMHRDGTGAWDGRADAFSQFADDAMALEDHGLQDPRAFYQSAPYRHRVGGVPFHQWMRPLRPLAALLDARINAGVIATRAHASPTLQAA